MGAKSYPNIKPSDDQILATPNISPHAEATAKDVAPASTTMKVEDAAGAGASGAFDNDAHKFKNERQDLGAVGDFENEHRPPLPPRPAVIESLVQLAPSGSPSRPGTSASKRPQLQSAPTIAVSSVDIQTLSFPDGSRGTFPITSNQYDPVGVSGTSTPAQGSRILSRNGGEVDDTTSLMSYVPTMRAAGDLESLLGGELTTHSPAWKLLNTQAGTASPFETVDLYQDDQMSNFGLEFDEIPEVDIKGGNEEQCLLQWKSKLKHYLILSSAGKPIYSRHGDQNLINGYIGIIQTIISFYEGAKDPLKGFTAGDARFVIVTEGPLYFVAISRLGESDSQLRAQLEALYMQILSTLTLPTLNHLFSNRPSTDLRRPLQGTEPLLSSLADTFTKGSPSALLSALECLKIRKSQRHVINNTLLKTRTANLLYGLIVAGGRLVSVVRPKRHSLHPSDLQLIFNMLFEAGGVKAGGGENWIPLCLPGFNKTGYLYMYVSFLSAQGDQSADGSRPMTSASSSRDDEIAILLISPNKESFYELKQMREEVVEQLENNGSMDIIKSAIREGRPITTDIVPGTQLRHFLYKSRPNVQFTMPSFAPHFDNLIGRRRLLSLYHNLHASAHTKHSHLKVLHCVSRDSISLSWVTPLFEFYCVAGPNASRAGVAQGANKIIQWVKREEERVFIIGGAVF